VSSSLTIGGAASDASGTSIFGPITVIGTVDSEREVIPIARGDNTVLIPVGAVAALFNGPAVAGTLTLRTDLNSGDNGLSIAMPYVYSMPTPAPVVFIINSSGGLTAPLSISFI